MFDDYVLYLLESLHCQERANDLMRSMKGDGSTGETGCKTGTGCFIELLQFFILLILFSISIGRHVHFTL